MLYLIFCFATIETTKGDNTMITISMAELKKNIDKYIILGQKEIIEVTKRGKVVFYITPEKNKKMSDLESLFGCLPRDAYNDNGIDRE